MIKKYVIASYDDRFYFKGSNGFFTNKMTTYESKLNAVAVKELPSFPRIASHVILLTSLTGAEGRAEVDEYLKSNGISLKPAPTVAPKWFDEWLDAFSDANPRVRAVAPAGRIAQEGWGTTADDPFITANIDNVETPRLTREQSDYLYSHKQELMIAALTGNYTVEKPKRWNVKVPHTKCIWYYKSCNGNLWTISDKELCGEFTEAEIEQYGLQDCEKEEVTDDEQ